MIRALQLPAVPHTLAQDSITPTASDPGDPVPVLPPLVACTARNSQPQPQSVAASLLSLPPELLRHILEFVMASTLHSHSTPHTTSLLHKLIAQATDLLSPTCAAHLPPLPHRPPVPSPPGTLCRTASPVKPQPIKHHKSKDALLPIQRSCRLLFLIATPLIYSSIRINSLTRALLFSRSLAHLISGSSGFTRSRLYAHCTKVDIIHLHPTDGTAFALVIARILARIRSPSLPAHNRSLLDPTPVAFSTTTDHTSQNHDLVTDNSTTYTTSPLLQRNLPRSLSPTPTVSIRQCAFTPQTWTSLRRILARAGWHCTVAENMGDVAESKLGHSNQMGHLPGPHPRWVTNMTTHEPPADPSSRISHHNDTVAGDSTIDPVSPSPLDAEVEDVWDAETEGLLQGIE
ncbi:hypothetical protein HDU93_004737, partial [Gonapodya sp. JEL0774]